MRVEACRTTYLPELKCRPAEKELGMHCMKVSLLSVNSTGEDLQTRHRPLWFVMKSSVVLLKKGMIVEVEMI